MDAPQQSNWENLGGAIKTFCSKRSKYNSTDVNLGFFVKKKKINWNKITAKKSKKKVVLWEKARTVHWEWTLNFKFCKQTHQRLRACSHEAELSRWVEITRGIGSTIALFYMIKWNNWNNPVPRDNCRLRNHSLKKMAGRRSWLLSQVL